MDALAIPGYELTSELARGGMGVIYAARDRETRRNLAIKLLHLPGVIPDPDAVARFRLECEVLGRLKHPHVVEVYEAGVADGLPFLAMELVSGGSLADRLRDQGRLGPGEAVPLVSQLCRAVAAAHAVGVLHRDLKPANVLLTRDGRPVLADFGLARLTSGAGRLTQTGDMLGTPNYMSPEQANGDLSAVGPGSDVYGLGAILYAALSGQPPHPGQQLLAVLTDVLERPPRPLPELVPNLDPDLSAICMRCLERDPARRFAGPEELAAALERWEDGARGPAAPSTPSSRVGLWALAIAGLTALALGGLSRGGSTRDGVTGEQTAQPPTSTSARSSPPPASSPLQPVVSPSATPAGHVRRAPSLAEIEFEFRRGNLLLAREWLAERLEVDEDDLPARRLRALVLGKLLAERPLLLADCEAVLARGRDLPLLRLYLRELREEWRREPARLPPLCDPYRETTLVRVYTALAQLELGQRQQAGATLQAALDQGPVVFADWRLVAHAALELGHLNRAIDCASRALELEPDDVSALELRALSRLRLLEVNRVRDPSIRAPILQSVYDDLSRAARLNPAQITVQFHLASCRVADGTPERGATALQAAADLDPDHPRLLRLAEDMLSGYLRYYVPRISGAKPRQYQTQARLLVILGRDEEAASLLRRAVPRHPQLESSARLLEVRTGRELITPADAARIAAEAGIDDAPFLASLGWQLYESGQPEEAKTVLRRCGEFLADSPHLGRARGGWPGATEVRAKLAGAEGRLAEAEALWSKLIEARSQRRFAKSPRLRFRRAQVRFQAGQVTLALRDLELAAPCYLDATIAEREAFLELFRRVALAERGERP